MKYFFLILSSLQFFLITSAGADCNKCNFDNKNLANFKFKDQINELLREKIVLSFILLINFSGTFA